MHITKFVHLLRCYIYYTLREVVKYEFNPLSKSYILKDIFTIWPVKSSSIYFRSVKIKYCASCYVLHAAS